jgi:putative transposase
MARRSHSPDQILAELRDADGRPLAEIAKTLEVFEQTYHRWRNQSGGMKGPAMKRLRELETEVVLLKRVIADQALDNRVLKDIAEGDFWLSCLFSRSSAELRRLVWRARRRNRERSTR